MEAGGNPKQGSELCITIHKYYREIIIISGDLLCFLLTFAVLGWVNKRVNTGNLVANATAAVWSMLSSFGSLKVIAWENWFCLVVGYSLP